MAKNRRRAASPLTLRALRYAEALLPADPRALATRLYRYPVIPASPKSLTHLDSPASTRRVLGIDIVLARADGLGWRCASYGPPWAAWVHPVRHTESSRQPMHKLYVSPALEDVRRAFQATAACAMRSKAIAFKVGADAPNLLRPDKLVVYFASRAALEDALPSFRRALRSVRPHGVPFTECLDPSGLISSGVDRLNRSGKRYSDRMRITRLAAGELHRAHDRGTPDAATAAFEVVARQLARQSRA